MNNSRLPISVSELNEYVRVMLSGDPLLRCVEVTGEISGYKQHISGHRYFSLKDSTARVQCVMFRQNAMGLDFKPQDGMKVTVTASASLYVRDGTYQLYVTEMRKQGAGDLYAQFEALKQKLLAEGLFDESRKRQIPFKPRIIGVATSKTGAAVRDIIRVARRRDPDVGIIIAPCAVQGIQAADEIVKAIKQLNENGEADVLLVGRGGGSIEDLWPFNEEKVARAIIASKIPVISCVGHEVDFTIADFVADVRAATPSMAAEIAVPVKEELEDKLIGLETRLAGSLTAGQRLRRAHLEKLLMSKVFREPETVLVSEREERLDRAYETLISKIELDLERRKAGLSELERTLRAVSPESVLERGYAVIKKGRQYVSRAGSLENNDEVRIIMADGARNALIVEETENGN